MNELHLANLEREVESLRCILFDLITCDILFAEKVGRTDFAEKFRVLREDLDAIIPRSRVSILSVAQRICSGHIGNAMTGKP